MSPRTALQIIPPPIWTLIIAEEQGKQLNPVDTKSLDDFFDGLSEQDQADLQLEEDSYGK